MTTLPSQPAPAPLSPEQLIELEKAKLRAKKIRRAAGVALTDGFITGFFAATALLCGFSDLSAPLLGLAMGFSAYYSFRCAARLKQFDLSAPRRLAWNQVFLFTAITLYALYNWRFGTLVQEAQQHIGDPAQLRDMPEVAERIQLIVKWIPTMLYGGLIVGTFLGQGFAALYYFTRQGLLRTYIESTPPWILELQRRGLA